MRPRPEPHETKIKRQTKKIYQDLNIYSRYIHRSLSLVHLRQTYCQLSLHRQTLLLVGSHATPPPFGTVFLHLYALLTASPELYDTETQTVVSRLRWSRDLNIPGLY